MEYFDTYIATLMLGVWPEKNHFDFLPKEWAHSIEEDRTKILDLRKELGLDSGNKPIKGKMLSPFAFLEDPKQKGKPRPEFYVAIQKFPIDLIPENGKSVELLFPSDAGINENPRTALENALKEFPFEKYNLDDEKDSYLAANALLSLFSLYLGTVPSGILGITLYEAARVLAATVICQSVNEEHKYNPKSLLFVKGDISGIQDYIFDVVSEGAAKSLKARSFRVQALSIMATDFLVKKLGLSPANVLYNGGGAFVMLVPASLNDRLEKLQQQVAENILTERTMKESRDSHTYVHVPETLQLFLGKVAIEVEDIGKDFRSKWEAVESQLNQQRTTYYQRTAYSSLFKPLEAINQTTRREAERDFFKRRGQTSAPRFWSKVHGIQLV